MEAVNSSETSVTVYQYKRHHIPLHLKNWT
jgi:hypothetical protein